MNRRTTGQRLERREAKIQKKKKRREKETVAGNGRSKTRAEVHYCLEGAPVFREADQVKKRACV